METGTEFRAIINKEAADRRLDAALSLLMPETSRSFFQKLIERGSVSVNGAVCVSKKQKTSAGDEIAVAFPPAEELPVMPEDIPLDIVYEDDDVIVVNKPAGMVVHPAPGNYDGTLVNALMYHCGDRLSSINGVIRPGIVHRIDKDTSGLLMVAKNDASHNALAAQLADHSITRVYNAIVYNNFAEDEGTVDAPIGRDSRDRMKRAVVSGNAPDAKPAVTHYRVTERFGKYTGIEARLETGRTHQIRVHMAHIKHPLLGDTLYGPDRLPPGVSRQMLHAGVLGFIHPSGGKYMEFSAPVPDDFGSVLEKLRKEKQR